MRLLSVDGQLVWKGPTSSRVRRYFGLCSTRWRGGDRLRSCALDGTGRLFGACLFLSRKRADSVMLQAEESLHYAQETLRGLAILLMIGSGAIMLIAWAGSVWIARDGADPIEQLSRRAGNHVGGADLGNGCAGFSPFASSIA